MCVQRQEYLKPAKKQQSTTAQAVWSTLTHHITCKRFFLFVTLSAVTILLTITRLVSHVGHHDNYKKGFVTKFGVSTLSTQAAVSLSCFISYHEENQHGRRANL
jgi:hypothetical protein